MSCNTVTPVLRGHLWNKEKVQTCLPLFVKNRKMLEKK